MKKVLLPILALALMFMVSGFSFAEETVTSYVALADFYDMLPDLIHDEPRVKEVISSNMVVKPRTEAHLSRFCDSAVANVMYYMNDNENNVQKGPDYTSIVSDELFYPGTRVINNSYIGGMISYKVACDFQTKKTNGEKIHMEVPVDVYQSAVIISSKTLYLDMGEEYTLSQPTGDQSQPNWVGTKQAYPSLAGRYMNWTFRFGALDSNVSGAFGMLKAKLKNMNVTGGVNATMLDGGFTAEEAATMPEFTVVDGVIYTNYAVKDTTPSMENGKLPICQKAKKFIMQYNLNPAACNPDNNEIRTEDGWVEIDAEQAKQYLRFDESENAIYYPQFLNAWGRVIAVLEVPTADDCKPTRRTIVKSRIGVKYPGFEFKNMKEGDVLKIYNVNGKKIREITSGTAEGFVWDGRDDSGDWAKSGIYIYQLKVDGKLINGTIAFVY